MRGAAALLLSAGLPLAAAAQDFGPIAACIGPAGFGAAGCDPAAAAEVVDLDGAPLVRPLHEAGMESFAAYTAMARLAEGIDVRLQGGDCVLLTEAVEVAGSLWDTYVVPPARLPRAARASYELSEGFVRSASAWLSEEAC
jgi:hypothetical protein